MWYMYAFLQAQFNHLGTVAEFLYHICENEVLKKAYDFAIESINRGK